MIIYGVILLGSCYVDMCQGGPLSPFLLNFPLKSLVCLIRKYENISGRTVGEVKNQILLCADYILSVLGTLKHVPPNFINTEV